MIINKDLFDSRLTRGGFFCTLEGHVQPAAFTDHWPFTG